MKLVRFGPRDREKPGLIDAQGRLRDLSAHCADIGWTELFPAGRKRLAAIDPATLPLVKGSLRLGVPFTGISKIVGVGLGMTPPHFPAPADALWQTTCCEPFLGAAGHGGYHEFNFSPSGQWTTCDFADTRRHAPTRAGWRRDSRIVPCRCSTSRAAKSA